MASPDSEPPFSRHQRYYLILKVAVVVAAVLLALAYLYPSA